MTEQELRAHVAGLVKQSCGSVAALARKHKVHPKALTLFLSGARGPSAEVAAAFGYERHYLPVGQEALARPRAAVGEQSAPANVTDHSVYSRHDAETLAKIAAEGAAGVPWVPQIGDRVEVTEGVTDESLWRQCDLWVAGVKVHDSGDGLDVTVSEQWPIPSRISGQYRGQTDDFRVGASAVADMLRPVQRSG